MKPTFLLAIALLSLASCAEQGAQSSSPSAEGASSASGEIASSEVVEETSPSASAPEESSPSLPAPTEGTTFYPGDFPEKENNTYPVGKVVEKDGYALECSYLMQGNQQRLDGEKEDVFQMKKGVGEIVSLQKVSAAITIAYLNKGEYTGNLVCYVGDEPGDLRALAPLDPVALDGSHYAVTYLVRDQFFAFRNDSSFAFYGTSFQIGAQG